MDKILPILLLAGLAFLAAAYMPEMKKPLPPEEDEVPPVGEADLVAAIEPEYYAHVSPIEVP